MSAAYREELRAAVEELIGGREGVRPGKMFGYPAFFAGRKLAVCVLEDGIGLRVAPDFADGLRPFERNGRAMSGWSLLMPQGAEELRDDAHLLLAAVDAAAKAA